MEQFADSPANMAYVEALFRDVENVTYDVLFEAVDDSPYSLRDWIEALREIGHWLDAHSMTMAMVDQIGYISCAAVGAGAGANLSHLPTLVEGMIETYGCERAVKK